MLVKEISFKEYNSKGLIDYEREEDACNSVALDYSSDNYLADTISETADSFTPIYNNELWKIAPAISEYIAEAMSEGLVDPSAKNFTLERAFMAGAYEYYTQLLYENLESIVFNSALNYAIENYPEADIDPDDLEDALKDIDNNNTYNNIESAVDKLLDA